MSDTKRYVQHISGQGERWEVIGEDADTWYGSRKPGLQCCWLPKSEYRLCGPPEQWVDVTRHIDVGYDGTTVQFKANPPFTLVRDWCSPILPDGFRFRKVQVWFADDRLDAKPHWAFIIEERQ